MAKQSSKQLTANDITEKDVKAARSRVTESRPRKKLTPELLAEAAKLRLGGMSYGAIAKELGVNNSGGFRGSVKAVLEEYTQQVNAHLQTLMTLDMLRIENAITAQYKYVLSGSERHFLVMLKAIKMKHEIATRIARMQIERSKSNDSATLRTDDEEYYLALRAMNSENPIQQLLPAETDPQSIISANNEVVNELSEKERERLTSLASDLEITIGVNKQQKEKSDG